MRIPLSWLREYVDVALPAKELAHRLTMAGLEVGSVEHVGAAEGGWANCFVGHVEAVRPHPNADRLKLCTVALGGGQKQQVVCGAPNVAEGQKIAFAKVGARLIDGHTGKPSVLKPARIRGVTSEGMICSEKELGLGESHDGILVLPENSPVGVPLAEVLGDVVLDAEPTANRPDWFSILGVAYEVAAITGVTMRKPDLAHPEGATPAESLVRIDIAAPDLCPRYCGAVVTGVKVSPSPAWMQQRLARAGMRPINNVVDVTNYVMLEYGQPLHAFDLAKLKGRRIVVRRAQPGEVMRSLDGEERKLDREMLVIADETDAVALAGVIGGANSEVDGATTEVLLESAAFNTIATRRAAQAVKARTEASLRFEKGLRPELPPLALHRAVQLILQTAGGEAARGFADVYPGRKEHAAITLTTRRIRQVLGSDVALPEAERVLFSLGFSVQRVPTGSSHPVTSPPRSEPEFALRVDVPPWRSDVTIEDDLVEEVVRIRGYDSVPLQPLSTPVPAWQPQPLRELRERVRDLLAQCTLEEVVTYSVVSEEALRRARVDAGPGHVSPLRLANPLSHDHELLRTSLRPGLLAALAANRRHGDGPLCLFEVGRVYLPRAGELPDEREVAAAVLHGPRIAPGWRRDEGVEDFYEAKGVAEAVASRLGLSLSVAPVDVPWCTPGRGASLTMGGVAVGVVGEVHPGVREAFDIDGGPVAYLELDLAALLMAVESASRVFRPLPRFPGAWRDLALVLDRDVSATRVEAVLRGHPLVAEATLFDVYEGQQLPADKRSLAYRVLLQAPQRTLTGEEVNEAVAELWHALRREANAEARA
ncbi:MAG: phenylalanine--tRNA ligase subunit beta [Dehalococcoidia bacterium]|nr:phenylalanine--tRNA ligase subunit beta [Dehalococcoidia bacterium]